MNQQLYDQLLDVASVIVGVQKFDEAIEAKKDKWGDLCVEFYEPEEKVKNSHKTYGKWTGWGVFMMIFGFVNALITVFAVVMTAIEFLAEGETADVEVLMSIVAEKLIPFIMEELVPFVVVIAVLIFMGFFGIFLFSAARINRKKYKKKAIKECEKIQASVQKKIDEVEDEIEQLQKKLQQFVDENQHRVQFLPSSYRNPQAVGFMLKAVENLRADNLTDLINLYEQELHFLEQERILNDQAEMQRIHNQNMGYALDAIQRNQDRINSNIQFGNAMHVLDILSR